MKLKKNKMLYRLLTMMLVMLCGLSGCGQSGLLSYDDAVKELESKMTQVERSTVDPPIFYVSNDYDADVVLDSIDTFPITVQGNGQINIEIAAATELSSTEVPDDLVNIWATGFNESGYRIDGMSVSATVRKITSGEVVTYEVYDSYRPDLYIPSFPGWGDALESYGFGVIKLTDRLAGNTAGILMKKEVYNDFIEKHGEVTVGNVIEAAIAGELVFAVTNPYSSTTGLNEVGECLICFDPENPLSKTASQKLLEYQRIAPPAAYTTRELQTQAIRGKIDAMTMEEQTYVNVPELKDYVYTPFGIRHDHPAYTFDYVSEIKQEAAKLFVEYCQTEKAQAIATKKGFNRHDDYVPANDGLSGAEYMSAQKLWKQSKNDSAPTIAVFVADRSGSMGDFGRMEALQKSLLSSIKYIGNNAYIGLVTYSDQVYINIDPFAPTEETKKEDEEKQVFQMLPFDEEQREIFATVVSKMTPNGITATYDGVLTGLNILKKGKKMIPEARLILFVLTDGNRNTGYEYKEITDIVSGMRVPVYTIGYSLDNNDDAETIREELKALSDLNEATALEADVDDVTNILRTLFISTL